MLVVDVKGDLPNLLLTFPSFAPSELLPWAGSAASVNDTRAHAAIAAELAEERRRGLSAWSIGALELAAFRNSTSLRVITPGASRLQVDADRARVLDGLALGETGRDDASELALTLQRLAPRWFVTRDAHSADGTVLVQPRWTMSFMRGPMTRAEIRMALEQRRSSSLEPEPTGASNGQSVLRMEHWPPISACGAPDCASRARLFVRRRPRPPRAAPAATWTIRQSGRT